MFRKNHKKYPVRTELQIQTEIVGALRELPLSTYGVAKAINCDRRTAKHNLEKLKALSRLKEVRLPTRAFVVKYWALDGNY